MVRDLKIELFNKKTSGNKLFFMLQCVIGENGLAAIAAAELV